MSEESKTYVFGNDSNSLLPALMNNGNFGGNGWWIIIILALLWGRNGFNGSGDVNQILASMNGNQGRDLLAQGIAGNGAAIQLLASTFNCDKNAMLSALNSLNTGIQQVGAQTGLSGLQVINAIQLGNMNLASLISQCCCDNKLLSTTQGYENRIALADQTGILGSKIDNQTNLINDKFCQVEMREMQSKIDTLREMNSSLRSLIDNANQTALITSYVNSVVSPVAADVAALKAAAPPTVAVPYPQLSAVPTAYLYGNYPYANGSIWS